MIELPSALSRICRFTLECLDRIVLTGVPQGIEYPQAYINHLRSIGLDPLNHIDWASEHRESLENHLKAIVSGAKKEILDGNKIGRKDDHVKALLENRGHRDGLICVIRSMERCRTYYYAKTKTVNLLPIYFKSNKCTYFYVYYYHHELGIVQIRIQTYAPFYCQVIVNGHRILERMLTENNIKHTCRDNAFETIDNPVAAQDLANTITSQYIESRVRPLLFRFFPFLKTIDLPIRFTIRQVEYSADIISDGRTSFTDMMPHIIGKLAVFQPQDISRLLIDVPKAKNKAAFKKYETEFGSCLRFSAGDSSVKLYDKGPNILRCETTCNDITKLKGFRTITHKNGDKSKKVARLSKHISSLETFVGIARLVNHRLIDRLGPVIATAYSISELDKVCMPIKHKNKSVRGFSFFNTEDRQIVQTLANPANEIHGFSRKMLLKQIPKLTPYQASYAMKRLHVHGLTKKLANSHRYFITKEGRTLLSTMMIVTKEVILPSMCA